MDPAHLILSLHKVLDIKQNLNLIYLSSSPTIDNTIKVLAQSNSLMNSLKVLVVTRNGLVNSLDLEDAKDNTEYEFDLDVTKDMRPEATVIVFYVRDQDGEIVYDQFKLELGFQSQNKVRVEILEYNLEKIIPKSRAN